MVEQVTANAKEMDLPLFRKPDVSVASVSLNANSVLVTSQVNSSECVGSYAPSSVPLTEKPLVLHSINIPLNVSLANAEEKEAELTSDTLPLKQTTKQMSHMVVASSAVTDEVRPEIMPNILADFAVGKVSVTDCRTEIPTLESLTLTETTAEGGVIPFDSENMEHVQAAISLSEKQPVVVSVAHLTEKESNA